MKTILVTAYAINPYKGSEDGAGWNNILQIGKNNNVVAITRENNIPHINAYIKEYKLDLNVEFYGYDLPKWARFWKRGQNGAMLYFYLWQMFIVSFIRKRKIDFDIAHNLNFHTDWIPTFLWRLNKPTVWGPVGHHPKVPKGYYHMENTSGIDRLKNELIWITKSIFWKIDPFFVLSKRNVDHVICMNSEAVNAMGMPSEKTSMCASVGSSSIGVPVVTNEKFRGLSVGRLAPLKGFDITLKSFHLFLEKLTNDEKENVELIMIGKGKMQAPLQQYITDHKLENNVKLINWMDRKDLLSYYKTSSLYFFPSHEGAGMVVLEALSFGVPILCFDNAGPGEFAGPNCGVRVPYTNYNKSIVDFTDKLCELYQNPVLMKKFSEASVDQFESNFTWDIHGELFDKIYSKLDS